jgi:hypothetical protein
MSGFILTVNKYDKNENLIETIRYDSTENIQRWIISKYDSRGHEIERIDTNFDGTVKNKEFNKYDDNM